METKANYLLVGSFALALAAGLLGFVLWLMGHQQEGPQAHYQIIYNGSVTGLNQGSAVRLQGVKVGEVEEVGLDPKDPSKVRIIISIKESTPIKADTRASLELEGLTGGRYLLLTGGAPSAGPLPPSPDEEYPLIPAHPSAIDQLLEGAPDILANVNLLLVQANNLVSEKNIATLTKAVNDIGDVIGVVASHKDRIDQILQRLDTTMGSLDNAAAAFERIVTIAESDAQRLIDEATDTMTNANKLMQDLDQGMNRLIGSLDASSKSFTRMANEIATLVEETREPLRDFASQGLFELVNFLAQAGDLVTALKQLAVQLERDPSGFIFGSEGRGYVPSPGR